MKILTLLSLLLVAALSVSGFAAGSAEKSDCDGLIFKCPGSASAPTTASAFATTASGVASSATAPMASTACETTAPQTRLSSISSSPAPAPAVSKQPPASRVAGPRKVSTALPAHLFM